jgi:hypothetical protein
MKSAYKEVVLDVVGTIGNLVMGRIWKAFIHERLKMHLWRIASNLLPTKDSMARYVPDIDTTCGLCEFSPESTIHLFWHCPFARAVWFGSEWGLTVPMNNALQLVEFLMSPQLSFSLPLWMQREFFCQGR